MRSDFAVLAIVQITDLGRMRGQISGDQRQTCGETVCDRETRRASQQEHIRDPVEHGTITTEFRTHVVYPGISGDGLFEPRTIRPITHNNEVEIGTALANQPGGFDQHRYGLDFAEQPAVDTDLTPSAPGQR